MFKNLIARLTAKNSCPLCNSSKQSADNIDINVLICDGCGVHLHATDLVNHASFESEQMFDHATV